jgi:two-component system response regulator MprA
VVDDDPMQLELVQRALGHEGFVVETTSTLEDAAVAVERFGPDLVLVDVNIPGMSGDDLRGFVEAGGARARVLLFSASDGPLLKSLAAKMGAHGWLSKSSALPEIARRLRELHESAARESPSS